MNHKPFICIILATALTACATPAKNNTTSKPTSDTTAPSLSGQYTQLHTIEELGEGDDPVEAEVTDCIALEQSGDALRFDLQLFFDNDHSCTMQGQATKQADGSFLYTEDIEDVGPCRLSIIVDDQSISIKDQDDICRGYYCGMRGFLDGASIPRAKHDPNTLTCSPNN